MIDEIRFRGSVESMLKFKEELSQRQRLAQGGLAIPNTKPRDFIKTLNAFARQLMNSLDVTDADWLESLGELALTCSRNMQQNAQEKSEGKTITPW